MTKYEKIFEELKGKYTLEEIAESHVFPSELSPEERVEAEKEFVKYRMEQRANRTPEQIRHAALMVLKYHIKINIDDSSASNKTSAQFIQQYIKITNKKQKEVADDLSINPSTLSRILNGKESIGKALAYRLERHSGNLIPAIYWWKLAQKEIEQDIRTNVVEREKEAKKVKNIIYKESA